MGLMIELDVPLDTGGYYPVTDAEMLFDLAPHLAGVATFAVHPSPYSMYRWTVSNVETGLHVSQGDSRGVAIKAARNRLTGQTPESTEDAYRKAEKMYEQVRNEIRRRHVRKA